jgi:hypothetical protein
VLRVWWKYGRFRLACSTFSLLLVGYMELQVLCSPLHRVHFEFVVELLFVVHSRAYRSAQKPQVLLESH